MEEDEELVTSLHSTYSTWLPGCRGGRGVLVREEREGVRREEWSVGGKRNGYYRERKGEEVVVGRCAGGERVGLHWVREVGGVWVVGEVDGAGRVEGRVCQLPQTDGEKKCKGTLACIFAILICEYKDFYSQQVLEHLYSFCFEKL